LGYARIVGRLVALIGALGFYLLLHAGWRAIGAHSPWPRRFLARVGRIVGARLTIAGAPRDRDVMLLANHLSWIDIMLIADATGAAFVAKAELESVPIIGWLCRLNDTIFVARANRLGIADQVASVRQVLATGRPVAIFPEGTTGDGVTLAVFKPALVAALDPPPPGIVAQGVRIDYDAPELAWVDDEPGLRHARRVLARRGTFEARLTFCAIIDPGVCRGRKSIAMEARRRIEQAAVSASLAIG
jgi:1-acyl-sn-glycerol-3-phosphate acyltransferase